MRMSRPACAFAAPPGRGRWLVKAPLPFGRSEVGVATVSGKIYVLGGYAHGRVDQPFNQEYDPATDAWRDRAPMPRGLNHVAVVGVGGKVYMFGGFMEQNRNAVADTHEFDPGQAGGVFPENEGYDPATDTWAAMAPMPTPRHGTGGAVVGNAIYIPAGGPVNGGSQQSTANEAFTPA